MICAPEDRLVMYNACDENEVVSPLGAGFRRRLDARRNSPSKPKKPSGQDHVVTPFNPDGFHFGKIRNEKERLLKLHLAGGEYEVLTNKFPLFRRHMLLVCKALLPQQMTRAHLAAVSELIAGTGSFCAYFNSWRASASVNHFHCHVINEMPPVTSFPLVPGIVAAGTRCLAPRGFPGVCLVLTLKQLAATDVLIRAMQDANQPHNLLVTPSHIYIFPKPLAPPARSAELYPETVGGPELIGSFTVYGRADYDALSDAAARELCVLNTAELPACCLRDALPDGSCHGLREAEASGGLPCGPAAAAAACSSTSSAAKGALVEPAAAPALPSAAAEPLPAAAVAAFGLKRAISDLGDKPPSMRLDPPLRLARSCSGGLMDGARSSALATASLGGAKRMRPSPELLASFGPGSWVC